MGEVFIFLFKKIEMFFVNLFIYNYM